MAKNEKHPVVHSDPEIVSGTPVFFGTRVPVDTLFDHLVAGDTIEVVLHDFPSVTREQLLTALAIGREAVKAKAVATGPVRLAESEVAAVTERSRDRAEHLQ
jgi:uncharacterized protein (DUF433 family)